MNNDTEFLLRVMKLKDEPRTGWMQNGVTYPESVAAHSFGTAFLVLLFGPQEDDLDVDRAVKMAVVHDIQEELTGDIPSGGLTEEEKQEKKDREREALTQLLGIAEIDTTEIESLWDEFNTRKTVTARFVKDMEELDMALQAYTYAAEKRVTSNKDLFQKNNAMAEFFDHAEDTIHRDRYREMVQDLRRKAMKEHALSGEDDD